MYSDSVIHWGCCVIEGIDGGMRGVATECYGTEVLFYVCGYQCSSSTVRLATTIYCKSIFFALIDRLFLVEILRELDKG